MDVREGVEEAKRLGLAVTDLIVRAGEGMIKTKKGRTERVLENDNVSDIFGIHIAQASSARVRKPPK